ncbi:very-long-chain 3-oxoacyl-CoA reductase-B-like [Erpetoichthys calabaricus]|uniref:Very-long-chain 3-oxoacyl-CoA reductase-B-like n=1 Tax=Erpetoichthys calabaricus TaxID=27687 RepID=A0A8C4S979_ERPCA|nr:very-long-chain 3-oxoacyl-CoA reductase-B-like [Erpetoichthys calabaricus]
MLLYVFAWFGVLSFAVCALKLLWNIWCGFRFYILSMVWKTDLKPFGKWAVVTGATAGIGEAYAHELARRGLNIVLISRNMKKLKNVAAEIKRQHNRDTQIIQADFTEGLSLYDSIEEQLKGLEIGILVNNVGMTYAISFARFLDTSNPAKKITEILNCNILSTTQMSRIVLPQMIQRKKGLIINLSSETASTPFPMINMYASTKIFINYFSEALNAEYMDKGIIVQCVMPFFVSTNMTYKMRTNLFVKDANAFANEALNTVGYTTLTSGCLSHALQHAVFNFFLPDWVRLSSFSMRMLDKYEQHQRPILQERIRKMKKEE